MVKPSRLSGSPSEPSLYSSWTDHHPGHPGQHHLHHHPGSDGPHHHLGGHQSHSDDHVHHQVAMKNGVTVAPPAHPPSMLNLWNSSGTTSNSGSNNNNNSNTEDITNDEAEDDNNHPSAGEINDLSHQAALSPSAIGSIKGKNPTTTNNTTATTTTTSPNIRF